MANDNAERLLELARERFGEGDEETLRPADEKLFTAVGDGPAADFRTGRDEVDDPDNAADWGDERTIAADRIVWLCTDRDAKQFVTHRGIAIAGALITGTLDLTDVDCPWRLRLVNSVIPNGVMLTGARLRALALNGSHLGGSEFVLNANGAEIKENVLLNEDFRANGGVQLLGIVVGGQVICADGQFINPKDVALVMDGADIRGAVFLDGKFSADGQVRLNGVTVGGQLSCRGGQFNNSEGDALVLAGAQIGGDVFLDRGFIALGRVQLHGVRVLGSVSLEVGSELELDASDVHVQHSVRLAGSEAVNADWQHARIDRLFDCRLNSEKANVLDLRSASLRTFQFFVDEWPAHSTSEKSKLQLHLSGLEYDTLRLEGAAKDRYEDWVRLQYDAADEIPTFHPQPYDQLATVLRLHGREEEAKDVLVAKNDDRAEHAGMEKWSKKWHQLLGWLIGYGYRPQLAAKYALRTIALGWFVFYLCSQFGWMKELDDPKGLDKSGGAFNSLMYSIDCFVPIVDFGQGANFRPNAREGCVIVPLPRCVTQCTGELHWGGFFLLYYWAHIAAGWVLSTFLVAAMTGLIRR